MPQDPNQQQLPLGKQAFKKAHRIHDYLGKFPGRVVPTSNIDMLECKGNILVVKSYEWAHNQEDLPKAQLRLWKAAVALGAHPDAPGSLTVICVWGVGKGTERRWRVIDYMGVSKMHVGNGDDFGNFLYYDWWIPCGGARR